MKESRKKKLMIVCCALLLSSTMILPAAAATYYIQSDVSCRSCEQYSEVPVRAFGRSLDMDAKLIDSTTYVPLRFFCEAMGPCDISYDAKSRTATVYANVGGSSMTLRVTDGSRLLTANGRCLYHDMPAVILSDNRLYVPVRLLEKAYGVKVTWDNASRSIAVAGTPTAIRSASSFYQEDEVYWLSKIISAEARGEPFVGQIAVGNVVLNRVKNAAYPNTIYGVIFDRKYGTQFSPVSNGSINLPATESSILAAKICLDGYSISEDVLYFIEPSHSTNLWVPNHRLYLFTVGAHWFYR